MAITSPSRLNISVPTASSDGLFHGRYPHGDAPGAAGGATPVFNFPNFSGSPIEISTAHAASFSASQINLTAGTHSSGGAFYSAALNIQAFTTDFTFKIPNTQGWGMFFVVQNSNATTNPDGDHGVAVSATANGEGYGAGGGQFPIGNSIGIKFDASTFNGQNGANVGGAATSTGLYIDGGPSIGSGPTASFCPEYDLRPSGVNVGSGNTIHANVVYDGTLLTMVLTDTVTAATTRISWPVNIPAVVGANTAFVGFTAGTPQTVVDAVLSWSYSTGFNTRLATPTFGPVAGQYASAQTVSINAPAGAAVYYTTDGTPPTTASTPYTGPFAVSANTYVQAVAVQTGFTDSVVATGNYLIQASSWPTINFPSGFASASGLIRPTGYGHLSGANIVLTDTINAAETAGAWYVAPVTVSTFNTTFTLDLTNVGANGCAFVLQNYPQTSTGTNLNLNLGAPYLGIVQVTGGPFMLGMNANNMGYTGLHNSIAVIFDYFNGSGNLTGLYTNGAVPTGSSIDMTGSGVSLHSGHPLSVNLAYDGTTLVMAVTDTVTLAQFTHSFTVDIPSIVGASNAYAGFTAGGGGETANVQVSTWTM